jgi:hypothetical protein
MIGSRHRKARGHAAASVAEGGTSFAEKLRAGVLFMIGLLDSN